MVPVELEEKVGVAVADDIIVDAVLDIGAEADMPSRRAAVVKRGRVERGDGQAGTQTCTRTRKRRRREERKGGG
jgi:hypothetical protein